MVIAGYNWHFLPFDGRRSRNLSQQSKMQETTALSTMQAEYVALSTAMMDLLPFKALMLEIATSIGLPHEDVAKIKTKVYEDNNGALTESENSIWRI
jgi:hypothetical protein